MTYPYDNNRVTLTDALLWVAIGVLFLLFGLTWWRLEALDDRLSRIPIVRPSKVEISGNYPSIRFIDRDKWDAQEAEVPIRDVFKKGGK